jgi:Protein of unknown function (DUF1566)/Sulfatase-modifying factor enzyme 1
VRIARYFTRAAVACAMATCYANGALAETATLLFRTDLECHWSIDGESKGVLGVDDRVRVTLKLGEHLIEAVPTSGGRRWEKVIDITKPTSQVFTIHLLAEQNTARLSSERAETEKRGYWVDPETRLMWAAQESGVVNWYDATKYCRKLTVGDYPKWRLPTIEELERLRDPETNAPRGGMQVNGWVWSDTPAQTRREMWTFMFALGGQRLARSMDTEGSAADPHMVMTVGALCVRP